MCAIENDDTFDALYDALDQMFLGESEKLEIVLDF
jgi:hypothetical protein